MSVSILFTIKLLFLPDSTREMFHVFEICGKVSSFGHADSRYGNFWIFEKIFIRIKAIFARYSTGEMFPLLEICGEGF